MNCRRAKTEMALRVGGDLDETSCHRLERHLAVCPCCRSEWQQLRGAHFALTSLPAGEADAIRSWPRDVVGAPTGVGEVAVRREEDRPRPPRPAGASPEEGEPFESLWPGISVRLARSDAAPSRRQFNGWVPALWVTAACVLVFVFTTGAPSPEQAQRPGPFTARPAGFLSGDDVRNVKDRQFDPQGTETISPEELRLLFPQGYVPNHRQGVPVREANR